MIPRATYRLQLRKEFTFDDAAGLARYLARLGISHVYASPILAARKGSSHGYDVVDHARINPELGGEAAFRRFVAVLKAHRLGLIVDIVPNHMAVGEENLWWRDVLEHGRSSPHARAFDIDWDPPDGALKNRVLVPILGASLSDTLARGEISVRFDEASNKPVVAYADHRFPLRSEDARALAGDACENMRPEMLPALLERQHYRLAWWRTAGDLINWRRFFDINDLIALRVEDECVFEAVHAKIFSMYAEGLIDGLRVDHVDGLADPASYCRQLRRRLDGLRDPQAGRGYLVVEKILAPGEELPRDWGVDGTTGYDFMNDVGALLHDPAGAAPLARLWTKISGRTAEFDCEVREARREILAVKFHGAFEVAARAFCRLYPPGAADRTEASEQRALLRLLAEVRIYRSYATGETDSPAPGAFFDRAAERALRRAHANDAAAIAHIVEAMNGRAEASPDLRCVAARRFNQLAASLAAKAGEDTALYRYGRLLSRNEVGSDPAEFAISPDKFHARARRRMDSAPLLATATHDHKRGEDARMRLAVLSEIHAEWISTTASWFGCNSGARDKRLDPADEYQLYQTLVGSWPLDLDRRDEAGLARFAERILGWRLKSLHEAKIHTSWGDPDPEYENASARLVRRLLDPQASADFLLRLSEFVQRIAPAAALNGLAQSVLRCTTPGVPDLYQGREFWDFSLVDPDNRRPVDFATRASALERNRTAVDLLAHWPNGALKQSVIRRLLALRTGHESCFRSGDYRPIEATGARARHLVCFARIHGDAAVLVAVPRLCARSCIDNGAPHPTPSFWEDTAVPFPAPTHKWRSLFGPESFKADACALACAELFGRFPVAVLASG